MITLLSQEIEGRMGKELDGRYACDVFLLINLVLFCFAFCSEVFRRGRK